MSIKDNGYNRGADSARVIEVLETKSLIGQGTEDNPYQFLYQYWNFDGKLLAESNSSKKKSE